MWLPEQFGVQVEVGSSATWKHPSSAHSELCLLSASGQQVDTGTKTYHLFSEGCLVFALAHL